MVKSIKFFVTFVRLLLDKSVCLPLNKGKEVNLSNPEKNEPEQILKTFPEKKTKKLSQPI